MKWLNWIEKYFWLFFATAALAGIFLPGLGKLLKPGLGYLLGIVIFLNSLQVSGQALLSNARKPLFLIYVISMKMLIVPLLVFHLVSLFDSNLAIAALLLCLMPAGTAVSALASICGGSISLALLLTVATSCLCIITVPLGMKLTVSEGFPVDLKSVAITMTFVVLVPFLAAIGARKIFGKLVEISRPACNGATIIMICIVIYSAISINSNYIGTKPGVVTRSMLFMFGFSAFLHIVGWFVGALSTRPNRISVTISHAYMNNALAIVIATKYFPPYVVIPIVLYEIPWDLMFVPFSLLMKKLGRKHA